MKDGVFGNDQVNRRLSPAEIQQVGDYVYQQSLGMWQDDSKSVLIVFHKKDSEWAAEIYKWASDMQRLNSVETIFSIYQGEETVGQYVFSASFSGCSSVVVDVRCRQQLYVFGDAFVGSLGPQIQFKFEFQI